MKRVPVTADMLPRRLEVQVQDQCLSLNIEQLLRCLPGQRIVVRASLCSGSAVESASSTFPNPCPDTPLLLKIFIGSRKKRRLEREYMGACWLRSASVSTPNVLWRGVARQYEALVLAFRWIPEAVALGYCEKTNKNTKTQFWRDFESVVSMLACLHNAGLVHQDPHLRNFIRSGQKVYAIDGDGVRMPAHSSGGFFGAANRNRERIRPRPLNRYQSLKNLALLLAQSTRLNEVQVCSALAQYTQLRGWPTITANFPRLCRLLSRARRRRLRRALAKTIRQSSAFDVQRSFQRLICIRRSEASAALNGLLAAMERKLAHAELIQQGNTATVFRLGGEDDARLGDVAGGDASAQHLVVKRYNIKSIPHGLSRLLRPSRGYRSWENAERLRIYEIPTVVHIALIEERVGPLRRGAYLVMQDGGERTLRREVERQNSVPAAVVEATVAVFEQMAEAGIVHGDCKANNFLIQGSTVWLVDLDAMVQPKIPFFRRRGMARDLHRFMRNWENSPAIAQQFARRFDQSSILKRYARCWCNFRLPKKG